jgi:NAD(P)-dependent dehydrogenase (short-subunit alcohol dehydrogenase family)
VYVCDVLDVLICSAGVSRPGRLEDIPLDMYERMMRVNYLGSLYAALAVTPFMKSKQQDGGRIMFVSSLAGLAGTHITSHHITYVHICMYICTAQCHTHTSVALCVCM